MTSKWDADSAQALASSPELSAKIGDKLNRLSRRFITIVFLTLVFLAIPSQANAVGVVLSSSIFSVTERNSGSEEYVFRFVTVRSGKPGVATSPRTSHRLRQRDVARAVIVCLLAAGFRGHRSLYYRVRVLSKHISSVSRNDLRNCS